MSTIGNIIWIVLGGIWMSLGWVIAGVVMYLTVIGIPWGRSCFVIAGNSRCFHSGAKPCPGSW